MLHKLAENPLGAEPVFGGRDVTSTNNTIFERKR